MSAPAMAPISERSQPPRVNGGWVQQLILACIVAGVTWLLTTVRMDAVQEQRIVTVEEQVKTKASIREVDELKREVLSRLDRIENKIDRAERRGK